jgi:hypothetical protein
VTKQILGFWMLASIKQQALRNWALRLWQEIKKSCFPDSHFLIGNFFSHEEGCTLIDGIVNPSFTEQSIHDATKY